MNQKESVPELEVKLGHSRLEVMSTGRVVPETTRCVQCGICSYNCPIGIDVRAHSWLGNPINDRRCLTCGQCVARCPRGALRMERLSMFDKSAGSEKPEQRSSVL